jgi:hypothetical protein
VNEPHPTMALDERCLIRIQTIRSFPAQNALRDCKGLTGQRTPPPHRDEASPSDRKYEVGRQLAYTWCVIADSQDRLRTTDDRRPGDGRAEILPIVDIDRCRICIESTANRRVELSRSARDQLHSGISLSAGQCGYRTVSRPITVASRPD